MKQIEEMISGVIKKVRDMEGDPSDLHISNIVIFPETWGSTALGFSGIMGVSAMTTEYSTCIKVGWMFNKFNSFLNIYAFFFPKKDSIYFEKKKRNIYICH